MMKDKTLCRKCVWYDYSPEKERLACDAEYRYENQLRREGQFPDVTSCNHYAREPGSDDYLE